ncbi:MAG: hypothetical protein IJC84_01860 [Clostridia bacterium]|nr:hypothetical protein [Clostridia bacterium]
MAWIERAAVILGAAISLGTLLCVTLPRLRALASELYGRLSGKKSLRQELGELRGMLSQMLADGELQREVDLCILRDLITAIYYKRVEKKTLRSFELKDLCALYELYAKRGGNSYVHALYEQMTHEWDVEK